MTRNEVSLPRSFTESALQIRLVTKDVTVRDTTESKSLEYGEFSLALSVISKPCDTSLSCPKLSQDVTPHVTSKLSTADAVSAFPQLSRTRKHLALAAIRQARLGPRTGLSAQGQRRLWCVIKNLDVDTRFSLSEARMPGDLGKCCARVVVVTALSVLASRGCFGTQITLRGKEVETMTESVSFCLLSRKQKASES